MEERTPQQFEALVDPVRHDLRAVAEGHGLILRELRETRADLPHRMDAGFSDMALGIKSLARRMDAHERDHAH